MSLKILIVGGESGTEIAGSFKRAALRVGMQVELVAAKNAYFQNRWVQSVAWRLLRHRPPKQRQFSNAIMRRALEWRADILLVTGFVGLTEVDLSELQTQGVLTAIYLTDDPWNKHLSWPGMMKQILAYQQVLSPRRANLRELNDLGCKNVHYMPFGFDRDLFSPTKQSSGQRFQNLNAHEILFAGGADAERCKVVGQLSEAGLDVGVVGSGFNCLKSKKIQIYGQLPPAEIFMLSKKAGACLLMPRRQNRDGHVMRTFEAAACGNNLLVEDTNEHQEIFAKNNSRIMFFTDISKVIASIRPWLKDSPGQPVNEEDFGGRLWCAQNDYDARLIAILEIISNRQLNVENVPYSSVQIIL